MQSYVREGFSSIDRLQNEAPILPTYRAADDINRPYVVGIVSALLCQKLTVYYTFMAFT